MSKIAVTGGAGFIGSHVVDRLIKENHDVVVIDDLSSGRKENINDNAVFYEVNICDPYLREVLGKESPESVIHLAAQASVRNSLANPRFDAHTNIIGSISLLESCKDLCIGKVVYASSVGVYGEPQYLPVDEMHPIKPISPYAVSKQTVENYLYYYKKTHNIDCVSLRFANVYGPRQDPNGEAGVIAVFINRLLQDQKAVINGDGGQTRDFVFVEDLAKAVLLALEKNTECNVFNIGTGSEVAIEKLYNNLKKIVDSSLFPIYGEPIGGEIRRMYVNPELVKKELEWMPETDLKSGLKKTISWFRSRKKEAI